MRKIAAVAVFAILCRPAAAEFYVGAKAGYLVPDANHMDGTPAASAMAST